MDEALLTFLFTDIEGSTRLWELDPQAMREALATHDTAIEEAVRQYRGSVFKRVGDACYCVFRNAGDAIYAGVRAQRNLRESAWPQQTGALHVRIGIHSGAALVGESDYFGPTLNRTARISAAAHGGQIIVSRNAASIAGTLHDGIVLRSLGRHRFRDLAEAEDVYQLVVSDLPAEFPPIETLDPATNNLPVQLTSFVGRSAELQALHDLLPQHRLITVAGPGGIGKTRFALQAAADAVETFADGCWFVKLDEVTNSDLVVEAIASTLHVGARSAMSVEEALLHYLCERHTLLILDNSEQVLSGVAACCSRILERCKAVSLLLTSREPTHLAGERVLRLGPMALSDATELFRERAGATDTGLRLTDAEMHDVHEICAHLDGIPLGVELASRHMASMSATELRTRVSSSMGLLISKDPTESARHRTLTATVEWSYRLLEEAERRFFDALSVFGGTFAPETCEFILVNETAAAPAIVLLEALIDKSFVTPVRADGATRYRLLDPIREFARAKCSDSHAEALRSRLLLWCLNFAAAWDPFDAAAMEAELPNIRMAFDFGFRTERDAALKLLLTVSPYWQRMQRIGEAHQWYKKALAAGSDDAALLSQAYRRAATFATIADDYGFARTLAHRARELAQQAGSSSCRAEAQFTLAVVEQRCGHLQQAYELYEEALQSFRDANHERGIFTTLNNQAMVLVNEGKLDEARKRYAESAELCRMTGDVDALASVLSHEAELALEERSYDDADRLLNEALALKRRAVSKIDVSNVLMNLGSVAFGRNNYVEAEKRAVEALREAVEDDSCSDALLAIELLAVILDATNRRQQALDAVAAARAMRMTTGYSVEAGDPVCGALKELNPPQTAIALGRDWKTAANELLTLTEAAVD